MLLSEVESGVVGAITDRQNYRVRGGHNARAIQVLTTKPLITMISPSEFVIKITREVLYLYIDHDVVETGSQGNCIIS